jgi:cephalosporin-C deacetylase
VRDFERCHGHVLDTLRYYDAACAARHSRVPVHIAAALFDPVVAPPGQFALYNALPEPKRLFLLDAGHFDYPRQAEQARALHADLQTFFASL